MLIRSPAVPAVALVGTGALFAISVLLAGAGVWLYVKQSATAIRTVSWVFVMLVAFGTVGVLVSFHLQAMLAEFNSLPLVADLMTVGAAVGLLTGRYDARSQRCHNELSAEQTRFASLFDNVPNPVIRYRLEGGSVVAVDANETFESVFGFETETARGRCLSTLLVPDGDSLEVGHCGDTGDKQAPQVTERQLVTASGLQDFQLISVPSSNDEGFLLCIDVAARKIRTRRLEVLNRVLRHDLRTDATVILGRADLLAESPEAEAIRERARAMVDRGNDARKVEQALSDSTDRQRLDLAELAVRRADTVEKATVRTNLTEATVYGTEALSMAIDELVENAVVHNDAAEPTVWLATTTGAGDESGEQHQGQTRFVTLEIADNGPGVPESERAVLQARSETPLQHSNGLGLWIAQWVVTHLGGEITVDDRDPRGTVIRLRLPHAVHGRLNGEPASN